MFNFAKHIAHLKSILARHKNIVPSLIPIKSIKSNEIGTLPMVTDNK